jgi:hypothetical protein
MAPDQSALLMETLLEALFPEMLLHRWGFTLARHGITLETMPEGEEQLELFWMSGVETGAKSRNWQTGR